MFDDSSLIYGREVYKVVHKTLNSGRYEIVSKNPQTPVFDKLFLFQINLLDESRMI